MITTELGKKKIQVPVGKIRNYNEIVDYLDALVQEDYGQQVVFRMHELDKHLGNISTKIDTILVGGTNGKSSTIHFASKLLKKEGFKVGVAYSSHLLTHNERVAVNFQTILNKPFADIINDVINVAETNAIKATAFELMTMAALIHFINEKVVIALFEVSYGGRYDATTLFNPKIAAVTRVSDDFKGLLGQDLDQIACEMIEIAKPGTWFVSSEQSKTRLQKMKIYADEKGIKWTMPIRKLATLPYIYEQLYGRSASLGERIAQIYIEDISGKFSPFLRGNLLATQKGQRGRPTLEAKRHAELNPIKTLKSFWNEEFELLKGRFELLDKERPSILLDGANNLDALTNLFLGVRLLHYQKPIKGLALVLGLSKSMDATETLKLIRYLFKKVNGQVFFVTLPDAAVASHSINDLANIAKELNIKAKACGSFAEAFEQAKAVVDERDGLVAIAGSTKLISQYWKQRGIKKF